METTNRIVARFATEIVNPVIGLLFAVAIAFFIWGIIEFIANADNETKRAQGKRNIIWGLVGLFIMTTVMGIIQLIQNFIQGIR